MFAYPRSMPLRLASTILVSALAIPALESLPGCASSGKSDEGACSIAPVWSSGSGFELTVRGGLVLTPADAGCPSADRTHEFSVADKTLTQRGCVEFSSVDRVVHLTDAQVDSILANLSSMRTTCDKTCGADAPEMVLTVHEPAGDRVFNSNFYGGCEGSSLRPPFVAFDQLVALDSLVYSMVAGAP
jgi:hypothetical protein